MILTDKEIRTYSNRNEAPLIAPFNENQLQAASYDVKVDGQLIAFKRGMHTISLDQKLLSDSFLYDVITLDDEGYVLQPNEYVLVELQETLTIPENMVAHLRPRTRFTRLGLLVADQHCNPTYSGRLSIGLFNAGPNALVVKKGVSIAQVVFEQLSGTPSENLLYKNKANAAYMNEASFRGAVLNEEGWTEELNAMYQELLADIKQKRG